MTQVNPWCIFKMGNILTIGKLWYRNVISLKKNTYILEGSFLNSCLKREKKSILIFTLNPLSDQNNRCLLTHGSNKLLLVFFFLPQVFSNKLVSQVCYLCFLKISVSEPIACFTMHNNGNFLFIDFFKK